MGRNNKKRNKGVKMVKKTDDSKTTATASKSKQKRLTKKQQKRLDTADDALITMADMKESDENPRHCTGVLASQPMARDVKIANFSLGAYGHELIQDTQIELTIGRKYGLVGPNGSGKSQFLKCLANREVPIPEHMDLFYLESEAPPMDKTALDYVLEQAHAEVTRLEEEAERLIEEVGPESEAVCDIYERLDEMEPNQFEQRATKLLAGLGFDEKMFPKHTKDMSGGWRMRVSLAQALFVKPTLLLLDDPTSHLDLDSTIWLEKYLKTKFNKCLIMVSHSRDFLNEVCTNMIHIRHDHKLDYYGGNYDSFERTKQENEVNQIKQHKKEQDDIKKIKQYIASAGTFANLVKQAKSKQKILDKMEAKGLTPMPFIEPAYNFRFTPCEPLPPPVVAFYDVAFSYSGQKEDYLYDNVELAVNMDSRIALVGPNGAGKSTLVKLMEGALDPVEGTISRHIHCKFGKFHQHSTEVLPANLSPLEFMQHKYAEMKLPLEEWRSVIGRYGVRQHMQTTPIGKLSDGQRTRLCFAMLAIENPNILLLDEPTNGLDQAVIAALADAISNFNGGLVLVSHDFELVDKVAKEIWVCDKGAISTWDGSIRDYKEHVAAQQDFDC
jgi:ATP-binding cassette, subfamily F, member 2